MKTFFKSKELPHQWAHQLAPFGRCAAHEHFSGPSYYSYNTEIARIVERKGRRAYLLNVTSYSNSTSKHQSGVRRAIPAKALILEIGGLGRGVSLNVSGSFIFNYAIQQAARCASEASRARADWKRQSLEGQHGAWLLKATEVNKFFGLRRKVDEKAIERLAESMERERKRQAKAAAEAEARREKELEDRIAAWLSGADVSAPYIDRVLLRVVHAKDFCADGNGIIRTAEKVLETSRGVTVPIKDAQRAFKFVMRHRESGWHRNGEEFKIGEFQLDAVNEFGVVAGCHRIAWSEIERLAAKEQWV